ncbi:MAG: hypothetical protein EOP06_22995 [Proteobacteria bacterium]|nr:MAG: hypothetical protein EOP06_22995 [Pseudomonadota bacterium]
MVSFVHISNFHLDAFKNCLVLLEQKFVSQPNKDGHDPLPEKKLVGLTENQIVTLVEANKGGSEWKGFQPFVVAYTDTLDGSRIVEAAKDGLITITTKEWIDHKVAEEKRVEAAVTEGF